MAITPKTERILRIHKALEIRDFIENLKKTVSDTA
jgi:hypothetical protein